MTQNERILDYIERFGSITTAEAMHYLGVMRLASRISELRMQGYNIVDEWETYPNRYGEKVSYKRYRMEA